MRRLHTWKVHKYQRWDTLNEWLSQQGQDQPMTNDAQDSEGYASWGAITPIQLERVRSYCTGQDHAYISEVMCAYRQVLDLMVCMSMYRGLYCGMYWYVLACYSLWYVMVCIVFGMYCKYWHVLICICKYCTYGFIHIDRCCLYWYVSMCIVCIVCIRMHLYVLYVKVCISRYLYVFVCIVHMVLFVLISIGLYRNIHDCISMCCTYLYVLQYCMYAHVMACIYTNWYAFVRIVNMVRLPERETSWQGLLAHFSAPGADERLE